MAGYIDDIDTTSPVGGDDPGDFPAEMRDFKGKIKDSFQNISAPVTATEAQLNYLSGVTPGTTAASKALVLDASSNLTSGNMNNMSLGGLNAAGTVQGAYVTDGTATLNGGTLSSATLSTPVINGTVSGTAIKDEDTMASDSATHLATQQSIKAYVDSVAGAASGSQLNMQMFTYTGTTVEWTRPAGAANKMALVMVVGGGGGGGNTLSSPSTHYGGYGGIAMSIMSLANSSYDVTVGDGGDGRDNTAGGSGGTTTFAVHGGATLLSASGGGGSTTTSEGANGTGSSGNLRNNHIGGGCPILAGIVDVPRGASWNMTFDANSSNCPGARGINESSVSADDNSGGNSGVVLIMWVEDV